MNTNTTIGACCLALAGLAVTSSVLAAPPTVAQVGDADSFGNRVVWLGLVATGNVHLDSISCAPDPTNPRGPNDRCVLLTAGGLPTNFSFTDLGHITLPGGSADTLLCQWTTPNIAYTLANPTTGNVLARLNAAPTYRIESDVLNDPALVNPLTGTSFDGYIDIRIGGLSTARTLTPGAQETERVVSSRDCTGGLISRSLLMQTYGLSEALAKKFFKGAITIRAGVAGSAAWAGGADIGFGTRVMGDRN